MNWNPTTWGAKVIGSIIVVAILAFLLLVVLPGALGGRKAAQKQAEVAQGQAGAAIDAGAEATNTLGNVAANASVADTAVATGTAEVRAAPEGQKGAATRKAACRFKANRNKPECQPKGTDQ